MDLGEINPLILWNTRYFVNEFLECFYSFFFVSYRALTHISGGIPVPIKLRDDLTMDPASIESSISEGVAAFIVNSPGNPTGGVQSKADMKEFARIADDYDILCISDEVYEHFVFEGSHRSPICGDSYTYDNGSIH